MSVLIKGMEMPKSCHECRLYEGDIYYCSAADKMLDIPDSSAEKCQFCPLAEVPQHGRLIDADELQRQFERMANEEWNKNIAVSAASCFDDAAVVVEDAPTIIERED